MDPRNTSDSTGTNCGSRKIVFMRSIRTQILLPEDSSISSVASNVANNLLAGIFLSEKTFGADCLLDNRAFFLSELIGRQALFSAT